MPALAAPDDGERTAVRRLDGQEWRPFFAPPVAVEGDLAEPEAADIGEPLQPLEQGRVTVVLGRRS